MLYQCCPAISTSAYLFTVQYTAYPNPSDSQIYNYKPSALFLLCIHAGERPFKCTQCDKAFNQKSALQVHMVKHTGKKPFKCEVCSIRFTQKSNMKHHMKRSHSYGKQLTHKASVGAASCLCSWGIKHCIYPHLVGLSALGEVFMGVSG